MRCDDQAWRVEQLSSTRYVSGLGGLLALSGRTYLSPRTSRPRTLSLLGGAHHPQPGSHHAKPAVIREGRHVNFELVSVWSNHPVELDRNALTGGVRPPRMSKRSLSSVAS